MIREPAAQLSFVGTALLACIGTFGLKLYRVQQFGNGVHAKLVAERRVGNRRDPKPTMAFFSFSASLGILAGQNDRSGCTWVRGLQVSPAGIFVTPRIDLPDLVECDQIKVACPYRRVLLCAALPARGTVMVHRVYRDEVAKEAEVVLPGFAELGTPLRVSCVNDCLVFHGANGDASVVMDPMAPGPVAPPLPMQMPTEVRASKMANPERSFVGFFEPDVCVVVCPDGTGSAFRLGLDLDALVGTGADIPLLLSLLQRRWMTGTRSLSLKALRHCLEYGEDQAARKCLSTLARAYHAGGPASLDPKVVCEEALKPSLGANPSRHMARRIYHVAVEYASCLAHIASTSELAERDCPSSVWEVAILAASHFAPGLAASLSAESPAPAPRGSPGLHPTLLSRSVRHYGGQRAAMFLLQQGRPIAALKEARRSRRRPHVPSELLSLGASLGPMVLAPALRFCTLSLPSFGLSQWLPIAMSEELMFSNPESHLSLTSDGSSSDVQPSSSAPEHKTHDETSTGVHD